MLGLFKKKALLSDDALDLQVKTYQWLLKNFGGQRFYKQSQLVLPNSRFFPNSYFANEDQDELIERVVGFFYLNESNSKKASEMVKRRSAESPLTIIKGDELDAPITYRSRGELSDHTAESLVAKYAHEVSHCLARIVRSQPPAGLNNLGITSEIASAFFGFGVITTNASYDFKQFELTGKSVSWESRRLGHLSELEILYALSIFIALKDIKPKVVYQYLDRHLHSFFRRCLKDINKKNIVKSLQAQDFKPELFSHRE